MPTGIRALSFDCFGTLIDWRFGQQRILRQLPRLAPFQDSIQEIAVRREALERELERGPWISYAKILELSVQQAVQQCVGIELSEREASAFAAGQLGWPAFSDSAAGLTRLAEKFPIALLSNCDEELLRLAAAKHLGVPVEWFVSAESVRSYKPAPAHWHRFLEESQLQPAQILHVSFAREYDLDVAASLGFRLGFVGRYGIEAPDDLHLDFQAQSMTELAEQILA